MADKLLWFKYVVKNVARNGQDATFMPKPLYGDNGSGMHCHQSLWKDGKPLFAGDGYAGMSEMAMHYIGGILKHAKALNAITNPTTNSYRRLVPGYEAPVNLAYSVAQPLGVDPHPDVLAVARRPSASRCASPTPSATPTSPSRRS
jgi:glutamine synthetase